MKSKYQDALQEAFLKSAFEEAAEQDIAEIEAMDIEVPEPTEKQRREFERALRLSEKKGSRFTTVKRAVAVIAVFLSISFALLMLQPTVRASVVDTVVSFFEKYVLFAFNDETSSLEYSIGDFTITYLPNGYYLTSEKDIPIKSEKLFSNGEKEIGIYLYKAPYNQFGMDESSDITEKIKIGNLDGYFAYNQAESICKLVWGDEEHTFTVKGDISEKEITKIAKNIK